MIYTSGLVDEFGNTFITTETVQKYVSPPGTSIFYAGTGLPDGWLECIGTSLHRSQFPELYEAIGVTYGSEGSDYFNIPDCRGLFLRALDSGAGIDSDRELGSTQGDAIRNITGGIAGIGDISGTSWALPISSASNTFALGDTSQTRGITQQSESTFSRATSFNFDASRQVPVANEVRPKNIAFRVLIKT